MYLLMVPLTVFHSEELIVLVWVVAYTGAGIFPLFVPARAKLSETLSLVICGVYMVYLPIWGINPWHFYLGILFPTGFLFGYWLLQRGNPIPAFIFFFLAGEANYP